MNNILWLASYPKSGNTWFRLFLANYLGEANPLEQLNSLAGSGIASSAKDFEEELSLDPFELLDDEVDNLRPALYRGLSGKTEELIFKKVHDAYLQNRHGQYMFPAEVSKGILYFVRNPLDVFVSYCNHGGAKIKEILPVFLQSGAAMKGRLAGQIRQRIGTWQEHVFSWINQTDIPIKVIRYEDMKYDSFNTFSSALAFAGIAIDEEKLKRAILNCQFEKLQAIEGKTGFSEKMASERKFFWKGKVGNYQHLLNEEQVAEIINASFEAMAALKYIDQNKKLTLEPTYEYTAV